MGCDGHSPPLLQERIGRWGRRHRPRLLPGGRAADNFDAQQKFLQMSGDLIDGTPARILRFELYGGLLEPIYERAVSPCMFQITGPKRAFVTNFVLRPLPQRTRPLRPSLLAHAVLLLGLHDGVPTATDRGNQNENTSLDVIAASTTRPANASL